MPDTPDNPSDSSPKQGPAESPAARLSALWHQGHAPDLRAFLAGAGHLSAAELTDVLCTDQRERWLHGQRPPVEAYLQIYGSFYPRSEPTIDLIFGEFLVRRTLGEFPTLDEYCRRCPDLAEQLRLHVGLYDALEEAGPAMDDRGSRPGEDPSSAAHAAQTPSGGREWSESAAPSDADAGAFESDYQSFKRLFQDMARERSVATLLELIVRRLAERPHVALARIWLVRPGDQCATCPARPECPDQTACLHLVASAGRSLHEEGDWSRLDGRSRRVPLGVRKVGLIAARGEPIEVADLEPNAPWLASPEWARREGIRGFGGQPLIHDGRVVGVLAVFFRTPLVGAVLMWLRLIADRAAAAVASEGGTQITEVESKRVARVAHACRFSPAVFPDLPGYEILAEVGRGGTGVVYKARQFSLQRLVAIKVIRPGGGSEAQVIARFQQESWLAAQLAHPNLVAAYDAGEVAGLPYFVMEFVEGTSLDSLVRQRGPLPVAEACEMVRQAALALQHMHEHGLVHRDVKPSNLMLTPSGQVKVLDLGLARLVNEPAQEGQITESGQFLGTFDYVAPEQCDNSHSVDIRADIYSLGCTLYHLLAGDPPFAAFSSPYQKLKARVEAPIPPIRERRPDVPEPLDAALGRMLAKDRNGRFATPAEGVAALHPFAKDARLSSLLHEGPQLVPMTQPVHVGRPPLSVGVLHSFSGAMVLSEAPVADATLLAIEEINRRGGIRGRKVEAFVRDCCSDEPTFAREAERLITQEKVSALFGCWTSASRKEVLPILARHEHLLVYPVQYEGLEQSPHVVYTGATPNQQMLPAVRWAFDVLRARRFFLLGWDSVYSHAAHAVIREEVAALGGQIVGEEYLLPASPEVFEVVGRLVETRPDVILNTVVGDRNIPLCRTLRAAGATPDKVPTIYFSVGELELRNFTAREIVGDYAAWNYFQSLDRPQNHSFVGRFRNRYGLQRVLSDPMEAAYLGVHLWAQAAELAGSEDPRTIREALRNQSFEAPEGPVRIDPDNQHIWKTARIGRVVEGPVRGDLELGGSGISRAFPRHPPPRRLGHLSGRPLQALGRTLVQPSRPHQGLAPERRPLGRILTITVPGDKIPARQFLLIGLPAGVESESACRPARP
jgi:urea transport system substrate-binding protein